MQSSCEVKRVINEVVVELTVDELSQLRREVYQGRSHEAKWELDPER